MSKGVRNHTDLGDHMGACATCKAVQPEHVRLVQPPDRNGKRHTIPAKTWAALCPSGREIYKRYLTWISTPGDDD